MEFPARLNLYDDACVCVLGDMVPDESSRQPAKEFAHWLLTIWDIIKGMEDWNMSLSMVSYTAPSYMHAVHLLLPFIDAQLSCIDKSLHLRFCTFTELMDGHNTLQAFRHCAAKVH